VNRSDHIPDSTLLLEREGELPDSEAREVRAHVEACGVCRARRRELGLAMAEFAGIHRAGLAPHLPPADAPLAKLLARLNRRSGPQVVWWATAAAALTLAAFLGFSSSPSSAKAALLSMPDSRLTPGATLLVERPAVCSQPAPKNKTVPAALRREVFREYGIPGADPRAYEVDYLVTPALGGADDIHNLWPHSYSAVWNARVKDALEDRLRDMVCGGQLDLTEAQRDLATNWIAAYKKYFRSETPLQ
jgi:hypothetical protein